MAKMLFDQTAKKLNVIQLKDKTTERLANRERKTTPTQITMQDNGFW